MTLVEIFKAFDLVPTYTEEDKSRGFASIGVGVSLHLTLACNNLIWCVVVDYKTIRCENIVNVSHWSNTDLLDTVNSIIRMYKNTPATISADVWRSRN